MRPVGVFLLLTSLVLPFEALSWGSPKPKVQKPIPAPVEQPKPTPSPEIPIPDNVKPVEVVKPPVVIPTEPTKTPNPGHVGEGSVYTQPVKVLPSATGWFTTNLTTQKCDAAHQKKVDEAQRIIAKIWNSEEFKSRVLNFTYNGKKQFNWPDKMTNRQIYEHLMKGAEALRPTVNYQMDMVIECYTENTSTIGYTMPSINKVYANMKFHKNYKPVQVASNSSHEWTHKMGFDHAQDWSKARDYTVPYGINTIIEELGPLAEKDKLTPLKSLTN